ncbi:MAG TPA: carboxypeptidase-like regulatory domain-containing protein, partial [Streptosporangiaceae bacterium]|nr:carboxypeptidase-like regulatory domain-containing protein [Streptosporangiaceae bacterium]
ISATLQRRQPDGSISGTVTGPKPAGKPLAGICVQVVPIARGLTPYLAETAGPKGRYRVGPLPPGRYLVEFEARCATTGYATQWWRGAGSMNHATPVVVRGGQSHSGINASMTPTG